MNGNENRVIKKTGWIVFSVLLVLAVIFRWVDHGWERIVNSDGCGYYSYLPATVLYQDLDFDFFFNGDVNLPDNYTSGFLFINDGYYVIKYPAGEALMLLPFFLAACLFSLLPGFAMDGYSFFFQIFVSIAAITYVSLATVYLMKLLRSYSVDIITSVFIGVMLVFATNLAHYTILEPGISHAYSFACITGLLWNIRRFSLEGKYKNWYYACCLMGITVLLRPVNAVVVLFIPALFNNFNSFKDFLLKLFRKKSLFFIGCLFTVSVIFIQSLLWYLQNGHWYVWTYLGERFFWDNPQFFNVLFSYRKGWFVYTPFMILLIPAIVYVMYKRQWFRGFLAMIFWCVTLYITSSWFCWYYGGSFGMRPLIDFYAPAALLIALMLSAIKTKPRKILMIVAGLTVPLNLVQSYQLDHNILHYDSMDKEKYWEVFLKTGDKYEWLVYKNPRNAPPDDMKDVLQKRCFNDFEGCPGEWINCRFDDISVDALSGNHVVILNKTSGVSPMLKVPVNLDPDSLMHIAVTGWIRSKSGVTNNLEMHATLLNGSDTIYKKDLQLISLLQGVNAEWQQFRYDYQPEKMNSKVAELQLYFSNEDDNVVWLDDLGVYFRNEKK